jgi:hypothetical protein
VLLYELVTEATPGSAAILASRPDISVCTDAAVTVPLVACQTTSPLFPPPAAEARCSRADAVADSLFCDVWLLLKLVPAVTSAPASATSSITQLSRATRRC